uniref:Membrane protein n=1 Tax=Marseillevirus sp. TaxID=2809551 RepID=A0AA96EL29_9VIRU|nr:membrane protein [Marseillevirus sp.]
MQNEDIEKAITDAGIIGKIAVSGVGLFCGFKTAVCASAAAFALGPAAFATFSSVPVALAFAPYVYGMLSSLTSFFFTNSSICPWIWLSYSAGALAGACLLDKPKILVPLVVITSAYSVATK